MDIYLIKAMIASLNQIEVKGKKNLDLLLGVINALEGLAQTSEKKEVSEDG